MSMIERALYGITLVVLLTGVALVHGQRVDFEAQATAAMEVE